MIHGLYPIGSFHIHGHFSSLALKFIPVPLLDYFHGLFGLASQCEGVESEMDVHLPSF